MVEGLGGRIGLGRGPARLVLAAAAAVVALPFLFGMAGLARRLATALAHRALPPVAPGRVDHARAPRRALLATLQIGILLIVGLPVVAVTQPFLPAYQAPVIVLVALLVLGVALWRSAADLQGHARAGAELIVEALAPRRPDQRPLTLEDVEHILPGLGTLVPFRVDGDGAAAGYSLAELNLRGRTGATIVALLRGAERITFPSGREILRSGDVVALSGSHEACEEAIAVLKRPAVEAVKGERASG
jgi:CPA2 family monovalent cation:H+ antiporter-2